MGEILKNGKKHKSQVFITHTRETSGDKHSGYARKKSVGVNIQKQLKVKAETLTCLLPNCTTVYGEEIFGHKVMRSKLIGAS